MVKTKSTIEGVYSQKYKNSVYWYARIDGKAISFGKGEEGRGLAEAAKGMDITRKYIEKERSAGIDVKRTQLNTVDEMIDWYLEDPDVTELKSFVPKKVPIKAHTGLFRQKSSSTDRLP